MKLNFTEKNARRVHISTPENTSDSASSYVSFYFSNGSSQRVALANRWGKQRISITSVATQHFEFEFGKQFPPDGEAKNTNIALAEVEVYES